MPAALPSKKMISTPMGRVAYLEAGAAHLPPILFVHGIPTSAQLWRHVLGALQGRFRCIAPDLMGLGDTEPQAADFSMPAQARMLAALLDALGLPRVHLVAHDQGGAAAQILAAREPQRIDRLVLSDVVCFDNWPVPAIRLLMALARLPGAERLAALLPFFETLPDSSFRRGCVDPAAMSDEIIHEYLRPLRRGREARRRFLRFALAGDPRHTRAVVPALRRFERPTLILWAEGDTYLPVRWGELLYVTIPGARRLVVVPGAGHFWPEEKPAPFAAHLAAFLLDPAPCERPAAEAVVS